MARAQRRLAGYRGKISSVIDSNKRAIGQLYTSGAIFSRQGTKACRDLLLAHQHLTRVGRLLEQLDVGGDVPAPRAAKTIEAIYLELDSLLDKTFELTRRTGTYLAKLKLEL